MVKVLEAVPNFSEGRDLAKVEALVSTISSFDVEVLDWSADPDHHRSVVTFIGEPPAVEAAALAGARFALDNIDLRAHSGVHPRVGALDVLPFVPLHGLTMDDAVASAHRVGRAIAAMGVPVFFYGAAADPPGRSLAELRRGGFEALRQGWPRGRAADLPADAEAAHPTAGVTCVGARPILLAWNVVVTGIDVSDARAIASLIRERDGGFAGLRALGLRLEAQDRVQISMNLEDPERVLPLDVFDRIEAEVRRRGGDVVETEVIGMMPDTLVLPDSAGRLKLPDLGTARVLSRRVAEYVSARSGERTETPDITE
ncbi:MAG: glutamate formimidoyltransferase [Longimicrobiales bacterium]|nr:glutamate formimidoyltransferase [Longimicrobiales bacterium]